MWSQVRFGNDDVIGRSMIMSKRFQNKALTLRVGLPEILLEIVD